MNELRFDPTNGQWVVIASTRRQRPLGFAPRQSTGDTAARCPFCPGNEDETLPEIERVVDPASADRWVQRVVPNRYAAFGAVEPAINPGAYVTARHEPGHARSATGAHEVIIESDKHDSALQDRSDDELAQFFELCQRRVRARMTDPAIQALTLYKNHGADSGASLPHPHSQLIALPIVPPLHAHRLELARDFHREHGLALHARVREFEREAKERVVFEQSGFLTFAPHASAFPYELWILPLEDRPAFAEATPDELRAAGTSLARALRALFRAVGACSYNVLFHVGLPFPAPDPAQVWFMQVLPRVGKHAGLELSTAISLNSVAPEFAAADLRAADSAARADEASGLLP